MSKIENLDDHLQKRLSRANIPPRWAECVTPEDYHGEWEEAIWKTVQLFEQELGDPSAKIRVATTGKEDKLDFLNATFAVCIDGRLRNSVLMPSGAGELDVLDSPETHAERKVLAGMESGLFGGWVDTLVLLVSKSPCPACSEALAAALGEPRAPGRAADSQQTGVYAHLVVAFLDFYNGPMRTPQNSTRTRESMPSEAFWQAMDDERIELFKVVWNDVSDDQRRRARSERIGQAVRAGSVHDHMLPSPALKVQVRRGDRWVKAPTPARLPIIGAGCRPVDPRLEIVRLHVR